MKQFLKRIHFMPAIWKDRCTGGKCSDCIERKHRECGK